MGESSGSGNSSFALSNLLLCHETQSCLNDEEQEDDDETFARTPGSAHDPRFVALRDEDEEYVSELVRRETQRFGSEPIETASSCGGCTAAAASWLRWARLDAIDWILRTGADFGFQHRTAYLSISYFDLFLSRRSIDEGKSWAIRLLSVACLSLAAKMEECRVPGLSEFPSEDYIFEAKVIQRMELLVLTTLDWRMDLITPFAYLHYFVAKFFHGESIAKGLASRAAGSLLATTKEISVTDHRPSVIAAAAVLAASDSKLTRKDLELKARSISWWMSCENESLYSCYSLMQEIEEGKHRTPESVISRDIQLVYSASANVVEDPSFASGAGTKRRLSFDASDRISPAKKTHRP